jgi:hypothetical protein
MHTKLVLMKNCYDNLIVFQLVKKLPAFYASRRFITLFEYSINWTVKASYVQDSIEGFPRRYKRRKSEADHSLPYSAEF